ncbi:MAG TPA: hypothetical protein PKV71_01350, partial [Calditrichia bacterium]|nr:hypothetical protein [Calditrichia bacterium]
MKLKIFGAVVLLALMSACGGSKPQAAATPPAQTVNIPDFITNRPQDTDEYLYEVGIGKSPDLSMGMSIAKDNGRGAIAEKISVQLGGMIKNFSDQVADGEAIELDQNFERVRETVYQQSLSSV